MNKDISFVEVSAIIVVILLLTRLPMKRGERPTVSGCKTLPYGQTCM